MLIHELFSITIIIVSARGKVNTRRLWRQWPATRNTTHVIVGGNVTGLQVSENLVLTSGCVG